MHTQTSRMMSRSETVIVMEVWSSPHMGKHVFSTCVLKNYIDKYPQLLWHLIGSWPTQDGSSYIQYLRQYSKNHVSVFPISTSGP